MKRRREVRAVLGAMLTAVLLAAVVPPVLGDAYVVAPGDTMSVTVLNEPSLSGSYTVDPDGKIALPLAGSIPVEGLTLDQVTSTIAKALEPYIVKPQVTVALRTVSSRNYVYALGQVTKTGSYTMERGWTIADLIAAAGGTTSRAALTQAFILRKDQTIPVDLDALIVKGQTSANVELQPGDVIIVPETKNTVQVMGEVLHPGNYTFKAGDRVVDVISTAGGNTTNAIIKDVGVIRQDTTKKAATVIHIDLNKFYKAGDQAQNVPLLPGDIVYVPPKGTNWLQVVSQLTGFATLITIFK